MGRKRPPRAKDTQGAVDAQRFTYLYSATVLGLAFLLLIYVGQYMEMVDLQMQVSRFESKARDLNRKMERLGVRKAELARLERLEFAAQERLGMILPGQGNVRYLPVMGTDTP